MNASAPDTSECIVTDGISCLEEAYDLLMNITDALTKDEDLPDLCRLASQTQWCCNSISDSALHVHLQTLFVTIKAYQLHTIRTFNHPNCWQCYKLLVWRCET